MTESVRSLSVHHLVVYSLSIIGRLFVQGAPNQSQFLPIIIYNVWGIGSILGGPSPSLEGISVLGLGP